MEQLLFAITVASMVMQVYLFFLMGRRRQELDSLVDLLEALSDQGNQNTFLIEKQILAKLTQKEQEALQQEFYQIVGSVSRSTRKA